MTKQRRIMTIEGPSKTTYYLVDCVLHGLINAASIRFDSSVGRGDFKTQIGVGKVIRGMESTWFLVKPADVFQVGMRVSRK